MVNADSERRSKAASRPFEVLVTDSDPVCSAGSISFTGARLDIFDCPTTSPPAPSREPLGHLFRVGHPPPLVAARTYQGFSCSPGARSKRLSAPDAGCALGEGHQLAERQATTSWIVRKRVAGSGSDRRHCAESAIDRLQAEAKRSRDRACGRRVSQWWVRYTTRAASTSCAGGSPTCSTCSDG